MHILRSLHSGRSIHSVLLTVTMLVSFTFALSEKPAESIPRPYAGYINPQYWDLSIGGRIHYEENNFPGLFKSRKDQQKWSAIMRLDRPLDISVFLGHQIHFITEANAADNYRLAPNFFVVKDQKKYLIWWTKSDQDLSRKYISFTSDKQGKIVGSLYLPSVNDPQFSFVAKTDGQSAFLVTDSSEITLKEIKNSLQTDWQHDIPGKYSFDDQVFPGSYGEVIFRHIYLGISETEPVIASGNWTSDLTEKEKMILNSEFGTAFQTNNLEANQYQLGEAEVKEVKNYYLNNKADFKTHPYFQQINFISSGDTARDWQILAKKPEENISIRDGKFIIENKTDPYSWTIVKIDEISSILELEKLRGAVRLSAQMKASELTKGDLNWQNVILEAILLDKEGNQINENENLCTIPIDHTMSEPQNISGTFVDEFIVGPDVAKIEILLKAAGAPSNDPEKKGITVSEFCIDKVALHKTNEKLQLNELLSELANKDLVKRSGKYLEYKSATNGLIVGDRKLTIRPHSNDHQIIFDISNPNQYSGLYSGLFSLEDIDELETAADFIADVKINGSVPDWASLTLQIDYFDKNGSVVYAADYGSERYPKIYINPEESTATKKSFFHVPKERGATYGQLKIHVIRKPDADNSGFDQNNFLTGRLMLSNIKVRPSLSFDVKENWLPNNGNFYKHINGSSLTWDFNGPYIKEDLKSETREVVFNNDSKQWSSMKTIVEIPQGAQLARGKMHIDISDIDTGIAQWQGFGFFLEADVLDKQGNTFHFSGIPVFQMIDNKLTRLERIPKQFSGKIDFYIPLYHEQLEIKRLYFQIAMAGRGLARIKPLDQQKNSALIDLELIKSASQPDIAAFWSQYALYAADADNIIFQKNYRMAYKTQITSYEFAETLIDHLLAKEKSLNINKERLQSLEVNEATTIGTAKIRAIPSYARVSREYHLPTGYRYLLINFDLDAFHPGSSRFNFKVEMLDENNNVHSPRTFQIDSNGNWEYIENKDVFEHKQSNTFLLPIEGRFKTARIVLGNNQGDLRYHNINIYLLGDLDSVPADGEKAPEQFTDDKKLALYQAKSLSEYDLQSLAREDKSEEVTTELHGIEDLLMGPIAVNRDKQTAEQQQAIANSIKKGTAYFQQGTWYYSPNKPFTPVGFTVVGETFNKWFEYRRSEFENSKNNDPYWLRYLKANEKSAVLSADNEEQYILGYARAQANIWQRMGINYIRVHQMFSSWSGLDKEELSLVVSILKVWQQEKGFLIDFDLLPNPDLSSEFFADKLQGKPFTNDLSAMIDLFKSTLVLPEIREDYIEPAIETIMELFEVNKFWPNTISYCNETGFTHGYWLIDPNNPARHQQLSNIYQRYYTGYLQSLDEMPTMRSDIHKMYNLFQLHLESRKLTLLLDELLAITTLLETGERVRDISTYIYYNLLRDDIINDFPGFKSLISSLKKDHYQYLATAAIDDTFYKNVPRAISQAKTQIDRIKQQIRLKEIENARELQDLLSSPGFKLNLVRLTAKTLASDELVSQNFSYIDSFSLENEQQIYQSFFTSFLLQEHFEQKINSLLSKYSGRRKLVVGLNNDYIKDPFSILQRSYAFSNNKSRILRFNKYSHHPVGGHSMLLNSGAGNVFDLDSKIFYNLTLFNPLYALGYPLCLSETNHTYAGGMRSGEGNWSFIDQLQVMASGHTLLGFRYGLNNLDKSLISDYFNIANRPNKVSQFNILAYIAALINTGQTSISEDEFIYNPYSKTAEINNRTVQAISGEIKKNESIINQNHDLKFTYNGKKRSADLTLIKTTINKDDYLIAMYGIERNTDQKNRQDNDNLIQSYGKSPILYEYFPGVLEIKVNRWAKYRVLAYYADTAQPVELSKGNYQQNGSDLKVFLLSKDKGFNALKIEKI